MLFINSNNLKFIIILTTISLLFSVFYRCITDFTFNIEKFKNHSNDYLVTELCNSHSRFKALFDNSPISLWEEDFSEVKKFFDDLKDKGINNIEQLVKDPIFLKRCISKMVLLDVNKATYKLFECETFEELIESFNYLGDNSLELFKEELINFFNGNTVFEARTTLRTLKNQKINVLFKIVIPEEFINDWRKIYVSVVDISETIQANLEVIKAKEVAEKERINREVFITNISSRFIETLNNIVEKSENSYTPDLSNDQIENLNYINKQANDLKSLILELKSNIK